MKYLRIAGAIILFSLLSVPSFAGTITYVNSAPNIAIAPHFGTVYGVQPYYAGECGPAGGNALDNCRIYMYDSPNAFQMLKWDMGYSSNTVRVYNDVENGWASGNGHDYLQWSLWGSNTGGETAAEWTLLWDPTNASGTSPADLIATAVDGAFDTATIYRLANPGVGFNPAYGDAFSIDFDLLTSYRYFGIRVSSYSAGFNYWDPEVNALATPIPEPASLLLLGSGLFGIAAKLRRKK